MKTELKAKYLQHLINKNKDKGFTLIELLVVIIIIGILAAIALPSFLNQAAKARQSEAKSYIGSTVRAQQAYRVEKGKFATNFQTLEIGIPTATQDYSYGITPTTASTTDTTVKAFSQDAASLRSYTGLVAVLGNTGQTGVLTCGTTSPSATPPTLAAPGAGATTIGTCPANSEPMR